MADLKQTELNKYTLVLLARGFESDTCLGSCLAENVRAAIAEFDRADIKFEVEEGQEDAFGEKGDDCYKIYCNID